ncbi:MAG: hypothetical protein J6T10_32020 [Methanobrevibacter sp.]|nr:hypothetical protein [Methanobrevibacter sp.]
MKLYRKICAVISLAIIYALVKGNSEFELYERIAWIIGVSCYCIAFNTAEDDD